MLIYSLFGINILIAFLSGILNKRFQLGFRTDPVHFISYNFINALLASVYFFVGNGFVLNMNLITFLYSVVFALIVILALILGILALSRVSISLSGITSTAGSTILSALFGILFLKEPSSLRLFLSAAFMLCAILIPYRKFWNSGEKNSIPICAALFLIAGASVILQKLYTITPGVCDSQSFFLMTNLIIVGVCAIVLGVMMLRHPQEKKLLLCPFSKKQLGNIAARTLLSNIGSIITMVLLANMNVSVYTVVSSALGIISGAILSKFVFREYMPRENWIAVLCAIAAILIAP
ncbi:MAG: hypothetical protein E7397_02225 [Ruminococcaceae bacterium]|nr:hypothetical protein [Oscillospiraceae bacterium]